MSVVKENIKRVHCTKCMYVCILDLKC